MQTSGQSSFMEKETPCIKSESSGEAGYIKSTQTYNHPSVSVDMPESVIENIEHSEKSIMFYIGLPDFLTLQAALKIESLIENGTEKLCSQSVGVQLLHVDEFFTGMLRLWLGLLVKHLESLLKISRVQMCLNMLPIEFIHHILVVVSMARTVVLVSKLCYRCWNN